MTKAQKNIISKLLNGHFIRKQRRGKDMVCVLYDAKINPIAKLRYRTLRSLEKLVPAEIELFKENIRTKDITINLSMVRRLHGNHIIKRMYNGKAEMPTSGTIYNKKAKRKKTSTDEKVYYLF